MTKVLGSGIDTLVLALDVVWKDRRFFDSLSSLKERAVAEDKECPGLILYRDGKEKWLISIRPYGMKGYEWFIGNKEITMKIGNWLEPMTRPSIMVEVSSEALWRIGPLEIYDRVLDIIEDNGGMIKEAKISRADLCIDILLDAEKWDDIKLRQWKVSQSRKVGFDLEGEIFETFTIGRGGDISARLYDKAREIDKISKKYWMYDIWKIQEVPEGKRAIRVEFQIRREVIKELGAGRGGDFMEKIDEVWAYCTKKWLQFKDGYGKEHKLRKTLPWWEEVQNGFLGVQEATPSIRKKAIRIDEEQLRAQIMGLTSSLTAIEMERRKLDGTNFKDISKCMGDVIARQKVKGDKLIEFKKSVIRKRPRYARPAQ